MAIIVVGGQSRSVGKTSVVAGLLEALPAHRWTAFKITQFGHGRCSLNGKVCQCATADHRWAISEENEPSGRSDTSRFLRAGAKRVFWVRTQQGRLADAVPAIRRHLAEAENALLESNSIVQFIRPDLYLTVLDPEVEDFKISAQALLDRADALILHRRKGARGNGGFHRLRLDRPMFSIEPPPYLTKEIIDFVASHLEKPSPLAP
jgi:hypothetical protein